MPNRACRSRRHPVPASCRSTRHLARQHGTSSTRRTRRRHLDTKGSVRRFCCRGESFCSKVGHPVHTFHFKVMRLGNVQQVVAFVGRNLVLVALLVDKCDPDLLAGFRRINMAVPACRRCRESACYSSQARSAYPGSCPVCSGYGDGGAAATEVACCRASRYL